MALMALVAAGCGGDGSPWATTTAGAVATTAAPATTTTVGTTTTAAPPTTVRVAVDGSGDAPDLVAAAALVAPGGTILLDAGEHRLPAPLAIDRPLTIRGAGSDQTTVLADQPPALLTFAGSGELVLEGIAFRYQGTEAADGLVIEGGVIAFSDVEVSGLIHGPDATGEGLAAETGGTGFLVRGDATGAFERCTAADNQMQGFAFGGSSRVTVTSSTATGNGETGFLWDLDSIGRAQDNTAENNGLHGFATQGRATSTLTANTSSGNGQGGFVWQDGASGRAEGNTAEDNGMHGFGTEDEAATTLLDNIARGNGECGFEWAQKTTGTARRNLSEGNGLSGFWVAGEAAPTLVNNIARSNRHPEGYGSGLAFAGTAGGEARRNEVYDNDWGIAIGPNAAPELANNEVHDNTLDVYEDAPIS
jgi:parallel beta-helix repeat protein